MIFIQTTYVTMLLLTLKKSIQDFEKGPDHLAPGLGDPARLLGST